MFGISLPELLVILAVALMILGPADLVRLCTEAGRRVRQARRAVDAVRQEAEDCRRAIIDEADAAAKSAAFPAPKKNGGR
jgi:Sec-independent protein translocase protein TatA